MRVLVLHQAADAARADEADTLMQAAEVTAALRQLGHDVCQAECASLAAIEAAVGKAKPQLAFNLVESLGGSDAHAYLAAGVLEMWGVPYTGNRAATLCLTADKRRVKTALTAAGIAVPGGTASDTARYIVKSATEHASFGMDAASVVTGVAAAQARVAAMTAQYGGDWVAEEYIEGREVNLGLIETAGGMHLLPPAEILFTFHDDEVPRIVDYDAKWNEHSIGYHHTPRRFMDRTAAFLSLAQRCWDCLGLRGYARIDLRLDEHGTPWVIDVNPNPCLAADAGLVAAAQEDGRSQTELIRLLVETAMNTHHAAPSLESHAAV